MASVIYGSGGRRHDIRLMCGALLSVAVSGCAPHNKAYLGPARPAQEVAVISPSKTQELHTKFVALMAINDQEEIAEWSGGNDQEAYILPGDYQFRVEFKQFSQSTMVPIVDLIMMIDDAVTAAEHGETNIAFPVKAGFVYRIHYKEVGHEFSVAVYPSGSPPQAKTVYPPDNAVACVEAPDHSKDFWCALGPPVE